MSVFFAKFPESRGSDLWNYTEVNAVISLNTIVLLVLSYMSWGNRF